MSEVEKQTNDKPEATEATDKPEATEKRDTGVDKCKQVIAFHNHVVRFFKDLSSTCPEFKRDIAKCLKYYQKTDRNKYIEKVIALMQPHITYISKYDEGIFSNDYSKNALKLLPGLNMTKIVQFINDPDEFDDEAAASSKKSIFNHLQSIFITAELAHAQINQFNQAMNKQKGLLLNMLKNLNMDERLKERVEQIAKEEEEEEADGEGGMNSAEMIDKLGELLGEDNFIFQLAKDVAEEINLGNENVDSPVDAISMLFANNGQRLQELIVTITEKIEDKVKKGEITAEELVSHATKMKERIGTVLGDVPELASMKDPTKLTEMFSDSYAKLDKKEQEEFRDIKELLTRDMDSWSDKEKVRFDEFVKLIFSKQGGQFGDLGNLNEIAKAAEEAAKNFKTEINKTAGTAEETEGALETAETEGAEEAEETEADTERAEAVEKN